ncbi:MAG TPA: biotin/lipoyl-containing protein, partial [Spirochaetia bacterium]|nr:biotin/lipoyl-containing protein [Spirochaetia bacterium]
GYELEVDGVAIGAEYVGSNGESRLTLGGKRYSIQTIGRGDSLQVEVDGIPCVLEQESGGAVKAPSPAVVLGLSVEVGDSVEKGDRLLSLEAMKMEMIIEAPASGTVRDIAVSAGRQVAAGEVLVVLETTKDDDESKAPTAPRIEFEPAPDDLNSRWRRAGASFAALFSGYDASADPGAEFNELVRLAEENQEYREPLFDLIYRGLETAVTIDLIFSAERIHADQFARPVSWQELIYIYFRYAMLGNESLPVQFVEALEHALSAYPHGLEPDGSWSAFYHMQRTQRNHDERRELVRSMIFTLEGMPIPAGRGEGLLRLLDEVVRLNQIGAPSLADAALHARYHLYEQNAVNSLRRERSDRIQRGLHTLLEMTPGSEEHFNLVQRFVDAGPHIVYELLEAFLTYPSETQAAVRELIAMHLVRDRRLETTRSVGDGSATLVRADGIDTVILVASGETVDTIGTIGSIVSENALDRPEVIVIRSAAEGEDDDTIFGEYASTSLPVDWLSVGIYRDRSSYEYRTYHDRNGWVEDERKASFSPLFYRELRVYRLENFDTRVIYHSDSVYLVSVTAKNNPRDERLFAFGSASESSAEVGSGGSIERVSGFDEVFMESVLKMRNEQAHRRRRLFWNRIIVHVRALIPLSAAQIKEYGSRIVPRTRDLGLEKAVVYTPRKRWSEDIVRELELLFLNISGDQFTLRSRKPSEEPYKPMDRYVSNVVRSRQRKNVYPYEVIKMITYTGYPVSLNVPRGDFEEYEIEVDDSGKQSVVSVKGRPYGRNESNIVFGIVRNQEPSSGFSYRRVLVLSDATSDMGSLSEAECRRVIAAIDLADEHGLPVEWIPISSGARIDMESGTENLDWTAAVLRRIIEFTQAGGEINIIVSGINVGAQSYWNAEATMLMHTRGLLIMT